MPSLDEAIHDPQSRVAKAVAVAVLTGSTKMKTQQPESDWLATYAWFYRTLATALAEGASGAITKHLGDGAMAIFSDANASDAMNWAIQVQEEFERARDDGRISCSCAIGIAYGEMVEFAGLSGAADYLGLVVDRAFRLCSVANDNAILVDTDAVAAAAMSQVKSRLGASANPKRTTQEYHGPSSTVHLKGFPTPVAYHELLWSDERYGAST